MIGIIFTRRKLEKFVAGRRSFYENVWFYKELAHTYKLNLCFYTINQIPDAHNIIQAYVYDYAHKTLTKRRVTIPPVNLFRTNFYLRKANTIRNIERLKRSENVIFINMVTQEQRNKLKHAYFLQSFPHLRRYLPRTQLLSYQSLRNLLSAHRKVYIKPTKGSLGKNIMMMEQDGQAYTIYHTDRNRPRREKVLAEQLGPFFARSFPSPSKYLVQQGVNIQEYNGKKFDIRVSVQKNEYRRWQVTGMVPRAGRKKGIVTNIAQGGKPVPFKKVFHSNEERMRLNIEKASLDIIEALALLCPDIADVGLDIALDEREHIWLLEANLCPLKHSYRKLKDYSTRQALYQTPFKYAYSVHEEWKEINEDDRTVL